MTKKLFDKESRAIMDDAKLLQSSVERTVAADIARLSKSTASEVVSCDIYKYTFFLYERESKIYSFLQNAPLSNLKICSVTLYLKSKLD